MLISQWIKIVFALENRLPYFNILEYEKETNLNVGGGDSPKLFVFTSTFNYTNLKLSIITSGFLKIRNQPYTDA